MGIDRQEALRRYAAGESSVTISQDLGIPQGTIRRWATEGHIRKGQHPSPIGWDVWGGVGVSPVDSTLETAPPKPQTHLVIPDTQCKAGEDLDHLYWAGHYARERQPDVIVHLGDHWDMSSLSAYEKRGAKYFEGLRYKNDVAAGNHGLELFEEGLGGYQPKRKILLRGNHEDRITRAVNEDPRLEGVIGFHDFNDVALGWEVVDFLVPIIVGGIAYSHYFYARNTGRPYSGAIENVLKNIGHSFTQGHVQGLRYGRRELANGTAQVGLIAGSYYMHNEDYRGPQAVNEWRGIIVKHEVRDGDYDPMMVSINYLKRRFGRAS